MSDSIQNMLDRYAAESDIMEEQHANPEELTITTDDTLTELEETLDDIADDVKEAEGQAEAAQKMVDVVETMESKIVMLRGMRERGENLNATAAKLYAGSLADSMESRGFNPAVYRDNIQTLTTSFESTEAYDYSMEAEEQTEGLIAKAKAMFMKALDHFMRFFKNLAVRANGLKSNLTDLGNKLVTAGKKVASNASTDRKISGKGLELITKTTSVEPIVALAAIATASKKIDSNENKLAAALAKTATNAADIANDNTAAVKIVSELDDDIKLYNNAEIKLGDNGLYKLELGETGKVTDTAPLSGNEIVTVGRELITLGTALDISEADQKALITKLESSINAIVKNLGAEAKVAAGPAMKEFNTGLNVLRSGRGQLNTYAVKVAKQAYRYAAMSANAY